MNRFAFDVVQLVCLLTLVLAASLAVDLVRDMRELPLYDLGTWSSLWPKLGALAMFSAGIFAAEQAAHQAPHRMPRRRR